jgi:hypothetical protein
LKVATFELAKQNLKSVVVAETVVLAAVAVVVLAAADTGFNRPFSADLETIL